jgi:uncharacterized protein YPO0396
MVTMRNIQGLQISNAQLQWTQNNCELGKRHSKRRKKMERVREKHYGEESEHV